MTPLPIVVNQNHPQFIGPLLDFIDVDVDMKDSVVIKALFVAVRICYGACSTELLLHGAHAMAFSRSGTPTFCAAKRGGHLIITRTMPHVNPNETLNITDGRLVLFLHYPIISNNNGFFTERAAESRRHYRQ